MTNTQPAARCARCNGVVMWEPIWNTYMHWDEELEDTHAVVLLPQERQNRPHPEG